MDEKQLEEHGWIIECESPLEIRHMETGSFATNIAADIIINQCTADRKNKLKKTKKGLKFLCSENDNEIIFHKEEGEESGEFHFGHTSGVGGWTVIGESDLKLCLMELGITVE